MQTPPAKYAYESQTEQTRIVMPPHLNGYGRLFGGQLALWIDEVAGIVAQRHCNCQITTAAIDNLRFKAAVHQNTMVVLRGRVTHVGNTSLEVRVDSYAEDLNGERKLINTAFVIEVAIDENGRPCKVPGLKFQSDFEQREFAAGERRKALRQTLNKDIYD